MAWRWLEVLSIVQSSEQAQMFQEISRIFHSVVTPAGMRDQKTTVPVFAGVESILKKERRAVYP